MSYDEQIKVIEAAKLGQVILGREKGKNNWELCDPRCYYREYWGKDRDIQFDFQKYEYKVAREK